MQTFSRWMERTFGFSPAAQEKLLITAATLLTIWLAFRITRAIVWRQVEDPAQRYRWRKTLTYVAVAAAALLIGPIWFQGLRTIATFLGLIGAGIVIALKDVVANVAGWLVILWRHPFAVGDRIQIGPHSGDVVDVRLSRFTLVEIGNWVEADQSTGRVIHVPNGWVLNMPIANYMQGFQHIWHEIPVRITYESDWRKAKALMEQVLERHAPSFSRMAEQNLRRASERILIHYSKLTPAVYVRGTEHGIVLTARYLCEPRRRRASEQEIWEDLLGELEAQSDVRFAYNARRVFAGDEPPPPQG